MALNYVSLRKGHFNRKKNGKQYIQYMRIIDRETVKMYAYDKIGQIKQSDQRK